MAIKRPTTIAQYIETAPAAGQPHLRRLHAILTSVAPEIEETIKWGSPFFVEPRFVFAFSAHKAHLSFALTAASSKAFQRDLAKHKTTKNTLKVAYDDPFPEKLIRKIAEFQLRDVREREDDSFW